MNASATFVDAASAIELDVGVDQYLTFVLGTEEYGINILRVQGIQCHERVTAIPNTPPFVLGVINLRGAIVPILDLRLRFGLPAAEFGPTTVVIVVKVQGARHERTLGLVVDAVCEVCRVGAASRKPAPDFGGSVEIGFVEGLVTVGERMVILLDIDKLVGNGLLNALPAA